MYRLPYRGISPKKEVACKVICMMHEGCILCVNFIGQRVHGRKAGQYQAASTRKSAAWFRSAMHRERLPMISRGRYFVDKSAFSLVSTALSLKISMDLHVPNRKSHTYFRLWWSEIGVEVF